MTAVADPFLAHVQRECWLRRSPTTLVRPAPSADGRWSLGALTVTTAELLAARPPGPPAEVSHFTLPQEAADFQLFRPLVYFAAFAAPEIFACLQLAVTALLEHGFWQWEVLVLTAPETVAQVRAGLAPCGLGTRLHVATIAGATTPLQWCLARYRIDAHPALQAARPLLYLDTDIVCDRPLEPLLMHLATSPAIHACAEGQLGEGHPDSAGHWFGWRLMAEHGMAVDHAAPGFSSGALGAADADSARVPYGLILQAAEADAARADGGRRLAGLDQPFANHVIRKLGRLQLGPLTRALNLHRLDGGRQHLPDPAAARGLVHFLGVPTAAKLQAMRAYVQALRHAGSPRQTPE